MQRTVRSVEERIADLPDIRKPGRCHSVVVSDDPALLQGVLSAINAALEQALTNKRDLEKAARDAVALCYAVGALPMPHAWFAVPTAEKQKGSP